MFHPDVVQSSPDLYAEEKMIASLTDETFFSQVLHKDYLVISNYYKHWSPACQRFSDLFKNFSRDIKDWNKIVKLVSIDCAENLVCYQALKQQEDSKEAINFPIIQFIPPLSKEINRDARQLEIDAIGDLLKATINEIITNSFFSNQYSLMPIIAKSINEICYIFKDNQKESYAIIEPTPSEFGAMIILDLINYRDFVTIKRFIGDHHLINSLFSYHVNLPVILEVSSSCQYRIFGNIRKLRILRHEFTQSIKNRFMIVDSSEDNKKIKTIQDVTKVIRYNLSYVDLHNALRYSLVYEISNRKVFNAKQVEVIKQLYWTILNFFPFDNENVKRFFKRMTGWLENKKSHLEIEKYLAAIKTSDGFLKPMESWRHCNGSRPIYRGYPCGLWVLFHTMVMNEYDIIRTNPDVKPKVLHVMRNYIGTFFTCSQCRKYFLNVSYDFKNELIYPNSSVLWLWKIHNQLNSHLVLEEETFNDPYYPKYQFPSKEMCQSCLNENGQYNEREVFNFLCHFYSKTTIRRNSSSRSVSCSWMSLLIILLMFYYH